MKTETMWHACVCCGIAPCDCAAFNPKTGEGCLECFECTIEKAAPPPAQDQPGSRA